MRLEGMNIVVTGASRGIGRAIALEAAKEGARVALNCLKGHEEIAALSEEIKSMGLRPPVLLPFDATDPAAIEEAVRKAQAEMGALGGWVNNAALNFSGLLPTLSVQEIRQQVDSALLGPIYCTRAVLPVMLGAGKGGSIVNIGSAAVGRMSRGQSAYVAAKGGLAAFTRAAALEYARKRIRVNCVEPGPVQTRMMQATSTLAGQEVLKAIPSGRMTTAEEVASAVVYLLSSQSEPLTGAVLQVDGGYAL